MWGGCFLEGRQLIPVYTACNEVYTACNVILLLSHNFKVETGSADLKIIAEGADLKDNCYNLGKPAEDNSQGKEGV